MRRPSDTLQVYRPQDLTKDEEEQLKRTALRLRAYLAALGPLGPHNRRQAQTAVRRAFKAVGFPIRRWPLILQANLSGQGGIVIEEGAHPWPIWEFLALATGVPPVVDPADPVGMMSCMPLPWDELLNLCCEVLREPPAPEPRLILSRPRRQLDDRKRIRESRPYFAVCGPPPNSSASYHDQGTTARRGRALYFFRGRA